MRPGMWCDFRSRWFCLNRLAGLPFRLLSKSLNLHPIAIILGIILGGELLGAAGMFLAVPFIVICKLVIEDIYHDRTVQREKFKRSRWLNLRKKE